MLSITINRKEVESIKSFFMSGCKKGGGMEDIKDNVTKFKVAFGQ